MHSHVCVPGITQTISHYGLSIDGSSKSHPRSVVHYNPSYLSTDAISSLFEYRCAFLEFLNKADSPFLFPGNNHEERKGDQRINLGTTLFTDIFVPVS